MTRSMLLIGGLVLAAATAVGSSYCTAETSQASGSQSPAVAQGDRYFFTLFTYEDGDHNALKTHTFATFVRVPASHNASEIESYTISWLPARFAETLKLGIFATKGKNYSLTETLDFAKRLGTEVRHYGPYEIDAGFYAKALEQRKHLDGGTIKYKIYNSASGALAARTRDVSHCIDAVADIAGPLQSGTARGHATGEMIVKHFQTHFTSPQPVDGLYDLVLKTQETQSIATLGQTAGK